MAGAPRVTLHFGGGCPDCGSREAELPRQLPPVGDDFDWRQRDYDSFRLAMLEELAARFAERRRWTPADMEVVLVEALAVVLDQFSDMLDRSFAEAFLETARNPASVRRLLGMLGYPAEELAEPAARVPDPSPPVGEAPAAARRRLADFQPAVAAFADLYPAALDSLSATQREQLETFAEDPPSLPDAGLDVVQTFIDRAPGFAEQARAHVLEQWWRQHPRHMEAARTSGPRAIHTQKRMVTTTDYARRLEDHPLVRRAHAQARWTGAWTTLTVAVVLPGELNLDSPLSAARFDDMREWQRLRDAIEAFHARTGLDEPDWALDPASRAVLRPHLEAYRMAGQEVWLQDARLVGIDLSLSVRVNPEHFQSEARRAVLAVLDNSGDGFFAPGRLRFGEDLQASDIVEVVTEVDGVEAVCLNRFKRVGRRHPNRADVGRIVLDGLEVAVCDNNPLRPERGMLQLRLHGGRIG